MRHNKIKIQGRVQGVWFRVCTRDEAVRIGLKGFVRNEADGSVYTEVEGNQDSLDEFIRWCHIGSEQSEVEKVSVKEGEVIGFKDFIISD